MRRMLSEKELIVKMDHVPYRWEHGMPQDICVNGTIYSKTLDLFTLAGTYWSFSGISQCETIIKRSRGMLEIDWWDLHTLANDGREYKYFSCYQNGDCYLSGSEEYDEDGEEIRYWIAKEDELIQGAGFTILDDPREIYAGESFEGKTDAQLAVMLANLASTVRQTIRNKQYCYATTTPFLYGKTKTKIFDTRQINTPIKLRTIPVLYSDESVVLTLLNNNALWNGYKFQLGGGFGFFFDAIYYDDDMESEQTVYGYFGEDTGGDPERLQWSVEPFANNLENYDDEAMLRYYLFTNSTLSYTERVRGLEVVSSTGEIRFKSKYKDYDAYDSFLPYDEYDKTYAQKILQRTIAIYNLIPEYTENTGWSTDTEIKNDINI